MVVPTDTWLYLETRGCTVGLVVLPWDWWLYSGTRRCAVGIVVVPWVSPLWNYLLLYCRSRGYTVGLTTMELLVVVLWFYRESRGCSAMGLVVGGWFSWLHCGTRSCTVGLVVVPWNLWLYCGSRDCTVGLKVVLLVS